MKINKKGEMISESVQLKTREKPKGNKRLIKMCRLESLHSLFCVLYVNVNSFLRKNERSRRDKHKT
jgi:hypothetical protein